MTEIILKAEKREDLGAANSKNFLKSDYLPAVVYGPERENINIKIQRQEFLKLFSVAGRSQVITLKIGEDQERKVLIHKIQRSPVEEKVIHVDFYEFKEDHKFSVQIPLIFTGESKAVKELGGLMVTSIDRINIECLAKDLINSIEVDLSRLEELNDIIYVSGLDINDNVKILSPATQVVVSVKAPKIAKEISDEKEADAIAVSESSEGETKESETGDDQKDDTGNKEGDASDEKK